MALTGRAQNAVWLLVIAGALLYASGGMNQLFSLAGIGDGYIQFAKSAVSLSPPTCTTFSGDIYGKMESCDNGVWKWGKAFYYQSPGTGGNPGSGDTFCYEAMLADFNGATSKDTEAYISANKNVCSSFTFSSINGRLYNSRSLKGLNYKSEFKLDAGSRNGGGATITLVDKPFTPAKSYEIYSMGGGSSDNHVYDEGGIEINPGVIAPNLLSVKVKGLDIGQFDITGWEGLYVQYEASVGANWIPVRNSRYQPLLSCVKEPDELLALESFSAGQELGIYSTRYAVQKFCLAHPVIVTSPTGSGTTAEPYQTWTQGGTLTVPQDQTWTVFYIMKNDGSLPTTCGEDAYDVKLGKCTVVSGLVQICSQGQFDPALGVCVVQPESINLCPEGGRYDTSLNKCVYNPPIQYICEQGTYDSEIGKCIFTPPSEANCPTGSQYDPSRNVCSFTPPTLNVCPAGYTYNSMTNTCDTQPVQAIVCPSGSTFNPSTNRCEQFPLRQIICDAYYAYDSILDKCVRTPPTEILCPASYTYDASLNKCTRFVPTQDICSQEGGVYDGTTGICTRTIPTQTECSVLGGVYDAVKGVCVNTVNTQTVCSQDGATYDSVKNVCVKTVPTQNVCSKGILSQDGTVCIYTPETSTSCPKDTIYDSGKNQCLYIPPRSIECTAGFTYDSTRNVCTTTATPTCALGGNYDERFKSCVIFASTQGICPGGQLIVERGRTKCVAPAKPICPSGYTFESNKCIRRIETPSKGVGEFITDPLFLISMAAIIAAGYLFSKKKRGR